MVRKYIVVLASDVTTDLRELHDYLTRETSRKNADRVFDEMVDLAESLETLPKRYRELGYGNYRCVSKGNHMLVYTVDDNDFKVNVKTIFDSRQNPQRLIDKLE